VIERPVLPTTPVAASAMAARAAIDRELQVEVVSPIGGGRTMVHLLALVGGAAAGSPPVSKPRRRSAGPGG
jgi:hypothetical protein